MRTAFLLASLLSTLTLAACGDDGASCTNCAEEVITTVTLTLTPAGGGTAIVAEVDDPDGDGGDPPTIDPIRLSVGTTYAVTVGFQNRLETPAEEITDEVRDEGVDHQVFFTGTAVAGPASDRPNALVTHGYTDSDDNGLPIGLANTFVLAGQPPAELIVTLRHMPPINGTPVKTAESAMLVKTGGFSAIGGEVDAQVTFPISVAPPS